MTPSCSRCKQLIPEADVNVAADVAYCRACHLAHPLSSLVHGVPLDDLDPSRPPAGTWYQSSGIGVEIGATHRSVGAAILTLAMALFWNGIVSVFVVFALSSTLQHLNVPTPDWFPAPKMNGGEMGVGMTIFLWLFLTPFIAIGLAMIAAFLSALGGRTEVRIRQGEGNIFTGVGPVGWRQRFNAESVKDVRIDHQSWRDHDRDRRTRNKIILEKQDGKTIKFGSMLNAERMKFVAGATRQAVFPPARR